jgi:pseudaminic acid biosynthesis-associated methylase
MSPQEQFWSGRFGDEYTKRNRVDWTERVPFWRNIIGVTKARSVLDVGCNAGWNLHALRVVDPSIRTVGIDVNAEAVAEAKVKGLDAMIASVYQAQALFPDGFDLVCTSGVLIHVAPSELPEAMRNIIAASRRWVLAVEYEAEKEEEVVYRGNSDRLWKRPFGRLYEAMGLHPHLYTGAAGFDRCGAWLMEKL